MRRPAKLLAAVAVACLAAAGGSAFTNSNTLDPSVTGLRVGYISTSIPTGMVIKDVDYTLSADGTTVVTTTVQVVGDTSDSDLAVGFNLQNTSACAAGTYSGGTSLTTYVCTMDGTNATITTTAITTIQIVSS